METDKKFEISILRFLMRQNVKILDFYIHKNVFAMYISYTCIKIDIRSNDKETQN